jgi:hypothetical protein
MTERRRAAALFLGFWALYGAFVSVTNLRAYTLQQMGVDALVSHGGFALGRSAHPLLQPRGDTFVHEARVLAAKQPGQFVAGAAPYAVLKPLGLSYEADYDLASALVTWLSSGLLAALALATLDRMLREIGFGDAAALSAVAALGLGSHWLAYAGIAHHDVIAACLIVFALRAAQRGREFVAGTLLGATLFVSMLPAPAVAVAGLAIVLTGAGLPVRALRTGLGFALGLLPLFAYNAWQFGSVLVPANVAGNYADTYPAFDLARIAHHLNAYFGAHGLALWRYSPALALGALALLAPGGAQARLRAWLLAAVAAQVGLLLAIETLGTCQYGPRYLLPVLPALAVGVAWWFEALPGFLRGALAMLIVVGFAIALLGAVGGTMYCALDAWAVPTVWMRSSAFEPAWLPLRWLALLPAAGAALLLATARNRK